MQQFTTEEEIQIEIWENGPVEGAIEVFDDFFSYKYGNCRKNWASRWDRMVV